MIIRTDIRISVLGWLLCLDGNGGGMGTSLRKGKTYWAFISYSSRDAKWGKWLHKRLENYPIPKEFHGVEFADGVRIGKHIRPVFLDRDELAGSAELGAVIEEALKHSRFLIVLCSPNSAKSKWVNKEIEDFRSMHGDGKVLALIGVCCFSERTGF